MSMLPLDGLTVLDFSQFLAGPSAALRLADLGATVIKVERPGTGDLGRQLYISNLQLDGDSTLFHTINRNKQSLAADLKNPRDLEQVRRLVAQADVLIQNFRPGVMDRLGLGYEEVHTRHPRPSGCRSSICSPERI
jgi:CoA:oxalate CoA-transferase